MYAETRKGLEANEVSIRAGQVEAFYRRVAGDQFATGTSTV